MKVVPGVPRAADDKPEDITIKYLFEVVLGQLVLILGKRQYGIYWAVQKDLVKGCRQILDCYCVSCELLSASIADALLFVNILVSGIFHRRFD